MIRPRIYILGIIIVITAISPGFSISSNLWDIPKDIQAKITSSSQKGDIKINEIEYISSQYKGMPVKIFGYFCYPICRVQAGMPGVVLVHGGAGHADIRRALDWANRGYAALSIDLPGKGEGRKISRSTGPNMDVPILLNVQPDNSYNYLYHAVRAARCGITFLQQQSFVNRGVAMVGVSWGGVITLITNGTDNRLAAAVPVFGSGYLDEGSTWQKWFDILMTRPDLKTYDDNFDARQYLKNQHAPMLYMTGTNDHCFYLPIFMKSYQLIKSECTLAIYPNVKHKVSGRMNNNIYRFVDSKLKGTSGFPTASIEAVYQKDAEVWYKIKASGPDQIKSVTLYYTLSGVDKWTTKKWRSQDATIFGDAYFVKLPLSILKPEMVFYASAKDINNKQSSTPIYDLFFLVINNERNMIIKTEIVDQIFEKSISRGTWFDIFGNNLPISDKIVPFSYLWKTGATLRAGKTAYFLKLPTTK